VGCCMREPSHICDVCSNEMDQLGADFNIRHEGRQIGGDLIHVNHKRIKWPIEETNLDLCYECVEVVANTLRNRME